MFLCPIGVDKNSIIKKFLQRMKKRKFLFRKFHYNCMKIHVMFLFITSYSFFAVAPSFVNITVNPQVLKEGQRVNLTCESGSSNPAAKMSWWKDGVSIPSHSNYTLPGENKGKRSVSVLMLDLTSELDNALYTCSANNLAVKKSIHDGIALQVACKF